MHRTLTFAALLASTLALAATAQTSAPLLPQSFAEYRQTAVTAAAPTPADAPVLHEYGLTQSAAATYASGPHQLTIQAYRFADATGAYGAFTFFRQPGMHPEPVGHDGAVSGDHHVFWNGTFVIDAAFAGPSADEKAALAALASQLPQVGGAAGIPPSLPRYLPAAQLDAASIRYVIGPSAWARVGTELPVSVIDFGLDTEAVTADYGPAGKLTLLLYPTPQIASAHLKTVDGLGSASGFSAKRAGPVVAIISGGAFPQKAQELLSAVRYEDYVTINHPEGYVPETTKLYYLLTGITMLVVILVCAALVLGFFFGGSRAVVRMIRGKPASAVSEEEFISLHLGN
jgi:hypothetical protein